MDREAAVDAALEFLAATPIADQCTIVALSEISIEHSKAWAVAFDSQEHIDTQDPSRAPFMRVVIVPKDGSRPHFPPSHIPVRDYVEQL
ncbi:YrhB domain-containing protein [Streptomyces sp. NPDC023838]|uniref:YrhB domain-containing protein n=1 Tax=Streptomyces sp. NPDC023838 TaxID=3154325 RepID=UPI0033C59BD6